MGARRAARVVEHLAVAGGAVAVAAVTVDVYDFVYE